MSYNLGGFFVTHTLEQDDLGAGCPALQLFDSDKTAARQCVLCFCFTHSLPTTGVRACRLLKGVLVSHIYNYSAVHCALHSWTLCVLLSAVRQAG